MLFSGTNHQVHGRDDEDVEKADTTTVGPQRIGSSSLEPTHQDTLPLCASRQNHIRHTVLVQSEFFHWKSSYNNLALLQKYQINLPTVKIRTCMTPTLYNSQYISPFLSSAFSVDREEEEEAEKSREVKEAELH